MGLFCYLFKAECNILWEGENVISFNILIVNIKLPRR